jgi:hypothetical protein
MLCPGNNTLCLTGLTVLPLFAQIDPNGHLLPMAATHKDATLWPLTCAQTAVCRRRHCDVIAMAGTMWAGTLVLAPRSDEVLIQPSLLTPTATSFLSARYRSSQTRYGTLEPAAASVLWLRDASPAHAARQCSGHSARHLTHKSQAQPCSTAMLLFLLLCWHCCSV